MLDRPYSEILGNIQSNTMLVLLHKQAIPEQIRNNILEDIENKYISQKNKVIFSNQPTKTHIAAAVYYVCSIPRNKGGLYESRLKIQSKPITYEFIQNYCKITKDTVHKEVEKIIKNRFS
jgi:hypothetical protein